LEKLAITLGALTLGTSWVAGYAWAQGGLDPVSDVSSVDQSTRVEVTPGVHGYGNATSRPSPSASPSPAPKRERSEPRATPAPARTAAPGTGTLAPIGAGGTDEWPEPAGGDLSTGPPAAGSQTATTGPVAEFNVASFNVLGSSHTEKGGHHSWLASGPQRIGGVLQILGQHDVSVVGMQEFQPNQRAAFRSRATGWQMYPGLSMGSRAGENSVAWRSDTWDLVMPGTVPIPYFNGRERPMPYVLLRHRATGVRAYFSTFHNPADTRKFRGQQRFRNAATDREIALFNRLESEGIAQFVTGDMNERGEYYCKVTARTALEAAAGGSSSGGCRPPKPTPIDWIFGSPGVAFSSYRVDRSPLVRRTTDHPVVVAHARVDPAKFANATAVGNR
jgi:hypothetical protein